MTQYDPRRHTISLDFKTYQHLPSGIRTNADLYRGVLILSPAKPTTRLIWVVVGSLGDRNVTTSPRAGSALTPLGNPLQRGDDVIGKATRLHSRQHATESPKECTIPRWHCWDAPLVMGGHSGGAPPQQYCILVYYLCCTPPPCLVRLCLRTWYLNGCHAEQILKPRNEDRYEHADASTRRARSSLRVLVEVQKYECIPGTYHYYD